MILEYYINILGYESLDYYTCAHEINDFGVIETDFDYTANFYVGY